MKALLRLADFYLAVAIVCALAAVLCFTCGIIFQTDAPLGAFALAFCGMFASATVADRYDRKAQEHRVKYYQPEEF
jgi:hypothetical protein